MIDVEYFAQAAERTGTNAEQFEAASLGELVRAILHRHGEVMVDLLCDPEGTLLPWMIVDVNGSVRRSMEDALEAGDRVRFIAPVSGG